MIPFMNRGDRAPSTRAVLSAGETLLEGGRSSFSPRRFLSEAIIWNARRKRLSQPFTIITIDGGGVIFELGSGEAA